MRRGRPGIRLHGEVAKAARRGGVARIDVSLAHSAGIAVAEAIVVRSAAVYDRCGSTSSTGSWSASRASRSAA